MHSESNLPLEHETHGPNYGSGSSSPVNNTLTAPQSVTIASFEEPEGISSPSLINISKEEPQDTRPDFDEHHVSLDDLPELNTRQILQNMSNKLNEHIEKEFNAPIETNSLLEQVFAPNQSCLVKLKAETLEFISGIETPNKYDVFLPNGLRLLAIEESTFFNRILLGAQRSFIMRICFASNKVELLKIERPFQYADPKISNFSSWFHQELIVSDTSRKGALLGKIQRGSSWIRKEFEIWDDKKLIYVISSPFFTFWTFDIYDTAGNHVGVIKKKWAGLLKEFYDDSDNFVIQYPKNCTSSHKALILSTTFLLEFMYFDNSQKTNA